MSSVSSSSSSPSPTVHISELRSLTPGTYTIDWGDNIRPPILRTHSAPPPSEEHKENRFQYPYPQDAMPSPSPSPLTVSGSSSSQVMSSPSPVQFIQSPSRLHIHPIAEETSVVFSTICASDAYKEYSDAGKAILGFVNEIEKYKDLDSYEIFLLVNKIEDPEICNFLKSIREPGNSIVSYGATIKGVINIIFHFKKWGYFSDKFSLDLIDLLCVKNIVKKNDKVGFKSFVEFMFDYLAFPGKPQNINDEKMKEKNFQLMVALQSLNDLGSEVKGNRGNYFDDLQSKLLVEIMNFKTDMSEKSYRSL